MVELHIILAIFICCLFSFFEIIVFDAEILLTLCFLSFLFYCFNTLSDSVFSSFEDRASKFEQDLLVSFNVTKVTLTTDFNAYLKFQSFIDQFAILMSSLLNYLSYCLVFVFTKSPVWDHYQACLTKFNELILSNKLFINSYQSACVVQLLYSLVLKKSTNDLTFLIKGGSAGSASSSLKMLCIK